MTDAVKYAVEFMGARAEARYAELLKPQKEETRTSEEIVSNISNMLAKIGEE